MMFVLIEQTERYPSGVRRRGGRLSTMAGNLLGWKVYPLPVSEDRALDRKVFARLPVRTEPTSAFWIGNLPSLERYTDVYLALRERNLVLPNTPPEHLRVTEFDRAYAFLEGLTPNACFIDHPALASWAAREVGLPVFVKGVVRSRKGRGWKACVASTVEELRMLTGHLLDRCDRSRGRVAVRQLVSFRHECVSPAGFPLGREFRVFVLNGDVVHYRYAWEDEDRLSELSAPEERVVLALAEEAARRLMVPFVAVDVGQCESGEWIVVDVSDPQFAGLGEIPLELWTRLARSPDLLVE
jgi:hypothetical protein